MTTTILIIIVTAAIFVAAYFTAKAMKADGYDQAQYTDQVCGRGDF